MIINLLPPEEKRELSAAKLNVVLVQLLVVTIGGALVLITCGFIILKSLDNYSIIAQEHLDYNNSRTDSLGQVVNQTNKLRSNLALDKTIFSQGISYSNILINLAKSLPSNTVLDGLTLDSSSFNKLLTLTIKTKDYSGVSNLKSTLQSSNYFSKVNFESISNDGGVKYPIQITLSLVLNGAIKNE